MAKKASVKKSEILQTEKGLNAPASTASPTGPADGDSREKESALSAGKKAFITTLIAIILNPFSVGLGYYLNHLLQKPQLQIELVNQTFYTEAAGSIPDDLVTAIVTNRTLNTRLRSNLQSLVPNDSTKPLAAITRWLDGSPLDKSDYSAVRPTMAGFLSFVDSERDAININLARINSGKVESEGIHPMQIVPAFVMSLAPEKMVPLLKGQLQELDEITKILHPFLTSLDEAIKTETNSGEISFTIGVLNAGDSDGFVKNRAHLTFGNNKSLWLATDSYSVIKAHSYEEIKFTVGGSDSTDSVLKEWEAAVVTKKPLQFDIRLNTGASGHISKSVTLDPVD
jgi:hypothetical protein